MMNENNRENGESPVPESRERREAAAPEPDKLLFPPKTTLLIGLGGTGGSTASFLKKRIQKLSAEGKGNIFLSLNDPEKPTEKGGDQ